jgi:mono/diheme cytochrome c family protein
MKRLCILAAAFGLALSGPVTAQSAVQPVAVPPPPEGASVQVKAGGQLYQRYCAMCHGANGRDATVFPRPIWGPGHDLAKFGDSKGLFEYLQLLMPFDDPAKLNDQQKTAIVAYILARNGNFDAAATLPAGGGSAKLK